MGLAHRPHSTAASTSGMPERCAPLAPHFLNILACRREATAASLKRCASISGIRLRGRSSSGFTRRVTRRLVPSFTSICTCGQTTLSERACHRPQTCVHF